MLIKRIANSILKWVTKPYDKAPDHSEYYGVWWNPDERPNFTTGVPTPVMAFKPTQVLPILDNKDILPGDIKNMPTKSWAIIVRSPSPIDIPIGTKILRINDEYYFAAEAPKWASYEKVKNYQVRPLTPSEAADIMFGTGAGIV